MKLSTQRRKALPARPHDYMAVAHEGDSVSQAAGVLDWVCEVGILPENLADYGDMAICR
jgi:hypothetical protein